MISDEAVEAAAKQMAVNDRDILSWVIYQSDAQRVLEAAAPYIAAAAWDEGEKTGYSNCVAAEHGLEQSTNPYRSQA